jgi:hypothetical protein
LHQGFGKRLAGLHAGSGLARAKYLQANRFKPIHQAFFQWGFWANHRQVNGLSLGKEKQSFNIQRVDIKTLSQLGHARITGCEKEFRLMRALGTSPSQGVFSATIAHNQYFHASCPFLKNLFLI